MPKSGVFWHAIPHGYLDSLDITVLEWELKLQLKKEKSNKSVFLQMSFVKDQMLSVMINFLQNFYFKNGTIG